MLSHTLEGLKVLHLRFCFWLVAMTRNPSVLDLKIDAFMISSLMDFVDGDSEKVLLCSVRALRRYLSRTKQYHPACANLLVSMTKRKKRVSQNTVLFWIRLFISHSDRCATDDNCRSIKVNAQEVWKVDTSLHFGRNCAVQQVLKVGTWFSQMMISAFYLWDVTHRYIDTFSIGPVVVAQEIVWLSALLATDVVTLDHSFIGFTWTPQWSTAQI